VPAARLNRKKIKHVLQARCFTLENFLHRRRNMLNHTSAIDD
jgi:hypothetical protein